MQDEDVIRVFLVESHDSLSRLDRELVELEERPKDAELPGTLAMKKAGTRTIAHDKASCVVFRGAQRSHKHEAVDRILAVSAIPRAPLAESRP